MQRNPLQWMEEYARRAFRSRVWNKFVQIMVCVVVFCTTYALILPALTMEQQYACGIEEHLHGDTCYEKHTVTAITCTPETLGIHPHSEGCGDGSLCGYRAVPVHTHEEICYDTQGTLICTLEALAEHVHTESCYEAEALICGLETVQVHTHSEACLDASGTFVCGLLETRAHQHTEACVRVLSEETTLVCGLEEHIHASSCNSDPEADVESPEQWEAVVSQVELTGQWNEDLLALAKTQLGYQESGLNFLLEEGGARKGYTRYGHWYGTTYADWDAMFVSFCLHYAGIPETAIPRASNSGQWLEQLQALGLAETMEARTPQSGAAVFFTGSDGIYSGIISTVDTESDETGGSRVAQMRVIAGNIENRVTEVAVVPADVLGIISMEKAALRQETLPTEPVTEATAAPSEPMVPTEPTDVTEPIEPTEPAPLLTQSAETENYTVTVAYSADLELPEGAELRVTEYAKDSDIFRQRCEEAGYELEWLLNIGFYLDDAELELDGAFDVLVTSKQGGEMGRDITHFADEGAEQLDAIPVDEEGQTSVLFFADGFSDFGGGVAPAAETGADTPVVYAAEDEVIGYSFVTANPADLQEGVDYAIYYGSNNNHYFLGAGSSLSTISVTGSQYWTSPYSIGSSWELSADQMGNAATAAFTWRVEKSGSQYYLVSQQTGRRLTINNGSISLTAGGTALTNTVSGAGTTVGGTYKLRYSNGWTGTTNRTSASTVYFAQVTPEYPNYPHAVHTGEVDVDQLRFYNICENGSSGVTSLAGCVFEIYDSDGNLVTTIVSTDSIELSVPENLPDGTYTIREVSVPDGYIRDTEYERTFKIKDASFVDADNIGTFINHHTDKLGAGKTAEVEDYNNRIYQVILQAEAALRTYQMEPVDVLFVVDQSNSMLFPSGLNSTGKQVTLRTDGTNNVANLNALNLDTSKMHYIISDPQGTSTVWCVWHDGTNWMYQDASYYAKAKHDNAEGYQAPNELAIFPTDAAYANQPTTINGQTVRANGGAFDKSLSGSGLGNYIDTTSGTQTFTVYTSTDEFNRLHYLEEALSRMIYELADANTENRVTLVPFTKEVDSADCMGPLELTPANVNTLVEAVTSINTDGGTRQDIALNYTHTNYLENNAFTHKDKAHTYTVLITDGAPVRSSGSNLSQVGSPNDPASTTADSIYAQIKGYANLVKEHSQLMTVGLGMESVEAGKQVLEEIATDEQHYCALDDAAALTETLQQLIFDSMKQKDMISVRADIVDEITDSFYPIAWVEPGTGAATGRQVLVQDGQKDWVLLQEGDWITLDGKYTTGTDAAGQLLRKEDGTFYIRWLNQQLSDPYANSTQRIAWVDAGTGSSTGRTVVGSDGTRDWILLNDGDWITEEGEYYGGTPSSWYRRYYGQYDADTDSVTWGSSASGTNRQYYDANGQWKGTFYVKAKEDFIGGNAIDTNKSASLSYAGASTPEVRFATPTVNVRLLDMNEMHSEVTVYLGDTINEPGDSPLDSLKYFYENTKFTKLVSGSGDVLNAVASAEGLKEAVFYLRYAMGRDLTEDEWTTLTGGGTITVEYTYDYASSHGPVGYFTFSLAKEGSTADYAEHTATEACQPGGQPTDCDSPVETYTLNVTYTAYRLGEEYELSEGTRPAVNVHNGTGSPGTEVGTGDTLETGAGVVDKENIHEVHVISGEIVVSKRYDAGYTAEEDHTFTFTLHRAEDGEDTSKDVTKTITIPAGSNTGSASITFDDLPRGTYTVTEALDEFYAVKEITVLDTTNCYSTPAIGGSAMELTFVMGNNVSNENVIGKAEGARYTSYTDPVNGVFGEAVFTNMEIVYEGEIPVVKNWSDGAEEHSGDAVYLVLYRDDLPVLDAEGRARILRVDASTNWTGSFTVTLADKDDKVTNYNYSVREASQAGDTAYDGWQTAVLENDGTTVLYYEKAVAQDGLTSFSGKAYIVQYEAGENGAWTVENLRAVEIPETGSLGTHQYTISGLLLIAAALVYGYSQRRKREGRGSR